MLRFAAGWTRQFVGFLLAEPSTRWGRWLSDRVKHRPLFRLFLSPRHPLVYSKVTKTGIPKAIDNSLQKFHYKSQFAEVLRPYILRYSNATLQRPNFKTEAPVLVAGLQLLHSFSVGDDSVLLFVLGPIE
jgi:hypothetical protein